MRNENLAFLLLSIYLILDGITRLISGSAIGAVIGLLGLIAGILFLLRSIPRGRRR